MSVWQLEWADKWSKTNLWPGRRQKLYFRSLVCRRTKNISCAYVYVAALCSQSTSNILVTDCKKFENDHHTPTSWFQTFAVFCMLYVFFWVTARRLNFICRRFGFGKLCLFHPHKQVGVEWLNLVIPHLPAYEDGTDRVFRNVGI